MKPCAELNDILMLSRAGERTTTEQARLNAHLAGCESCGAALAENSAIQSSLDEARTIIAEKGKEPDIAGAVLAEIQLSSLRQPLIRKQSAFDAAIEWLIPALATPLVALLLLFVVQESTDYSKITALEQRMKIAGSSVSGSVAIAAPQSISGIRKTLAGATEFATADERTLLFKITDLLTDLISKGGSTRMETANSLAGARFPAITALLHGRQINDRRRQVLVSEGITLLNEMRTGQFRELLMKGIQ